MDSAEIAKRFTYQPPKPERQADFKAIRQDAWQLAETVLAHTPASREQSLAITAIEEAVMWANAAIARNQ